MITQPRGKEHLVEAFKNAGAEVLTTRGSYCKVDLIIPTVDEELPSFSYLRHTLPIMCASSYTIDMCRDKAEFHRFCWRHSFRVPLTMQENLVAKPRFGKASKGIIYLDRSYIIQEDLSALPEISIDYFADWKGNPLSVIPRYRKGVVNGESTQLDMVPAFEHLEEVRRLGQELGLIGHNVIQGFYTHTQLYYTEVNPRFGGGSWLTFPIFNSPKWLLEHPYEPYS